jgi:hypothetical protein
MVWESSIKMSIFSFVVIETKSILIEKDRYRKHDFIKMDNGFYIYSRQQPPSIIDSKGILSSKFLEFICIITNEIKCDVFFLITDLKNNDLKISTSNLAKKSIIIQSNNSISLDLLYRYPYIL